jgi:adenylate cyclase
MLVEFPSIVEAVACAAAWQAAIDGDIRWRIGINVGDVIIDEEDIYGDGVNIAARLEALAEPGGICVSARVQEDAAGRLDLEFEDIGEQSLKNIARRVRVYRVASPHPKPVPQAGEAERDSRPVGALDAPALALPDKPSIAVLPFQNMSGDPDQEYFADGMVEEIITALSRIRWLFVIARNSSFTYKGQHVDVKQVGRELGVRYVLEGSVRKAGGRVRITTQLIDARTATHIWADRFDGLLEDVFELQDKVAVSISGVIEPALEVAEIRRSSVRPTIDLTAYDLYLRALASLSTTTKDGVIEALRLLEQTIAIDRHYGPALVWAAVCHGRLADQGWADDIDTSRRKASDLARQALEVAENDPRILANAANVLGRFGEDMGTMIGLVDRALALNPSFARGWYVSGLLRLFDGQHDLAIEHVETSLRLSPREQVGEPLWVIGLAYFFKRRFDVAASKLLLAIQHHPRHPPSHRGLAACYAHMGRLDEARAVVAHLRTLAVPDAGRAPPWRNPEDRDLFMSGLRLAIGETQ